MRVSELMQTKVQTVHPDDAVNDAVVTLTDAHVSALPVVDETGSGLSGCSRRRSCGIARIGSRPAGTSTSMTSTSRRGRGSSTPRCTRIAPP